MSSAEGRLSPEQVEKVRARARAFQQQLVTTTTKKLAATQAQTENGAFFFELFRLAGTLIGNDTDEFCERAEELFEEIEAFGQDPELDIDWLDEITGEKESFYFSTENLVSDLISPPRKSRRKKPLSDEEVARFTAEVEGAILEEDQSFAQAMSVAHGEDPKSWIKRIKSALLAEAGTAEFWRLHHLTDLSPGALFLGLLLGQENWALRQDQFYSSFEAELYN